MLGAKLADRIGSVNATVLTHLPGTLLAILLPFAPNFRTAAVILIIREFISRMDSPIKQSYLMAIVPREERARARGITSAFRRFPASFSPTIAGYMMSSISTSIPFFVGGIIEITHDILYWFTFRKIKPPEEMATESIEIGPDP